MDSFGSPSTKANKLSQPRPTLIAPHRAKNVSRFTDHNGDNRANSFATQYTGLILIVFTVIIGSLSAHSLEQQKEAKNNKETHTLGRVSLHRLFEEGSIDPDFQQLAVIKELLTHHDIRGELIIPFTKKSATLGFQRIIALRTKIKELGIPSSYLAVQLDEQHDKPPILIIEPAE